MKREETLSTSLRCALVIVLTLITSAKAQSAEPSSQLVLENEFVRINRVTIPPKADFSVVGKNDTVAVRLQDEAERFIPAGGRITEVNSTDHVNTVLLVELKKHRDAEMRPCSFPMKCTRETKVGDESIAWTTTLFTNGFVTGTTHKVIRGGTLTSSYYSSKGSDRIIVIPFTDLSINVGGIDENLKAGQPYFGVGTEVEVTSKDSESRWFVLRLTAVEK
jgi:hypothetical protein